MSTPAQRYAASRRRARESRSRGGASTEGQPSPEALAAVDAFAAELAFPLDDFQREACEAVAAGRGVLVAAPTGAGKTVVGEFAVHQALATGRKAFYTTPIKALSNQKYLDLVARHGAARVGLLTGDSQVNGEAPVVVMTTEVLRNMMYAGSSTLDGLGYVVMDEVHYLADRFRGAVWEEVIIHLPQDVQVVSLSATVSNAEEFGEWLGEVRGGGSTGQRTAVVVSEHRPVPLWQHLMVGSRILDLFVEAEVSGRAAVNPEVLDAIRHVERADQWTGGGGRRGRPAPGGPGGGAGGRGFARAGRGGRGGGAPSRYEVVDQLDRAGLLPAITFIFSRVGCDAAVGQLLAAGVRLVPPDEGLRIRRIVEERVAGIAEEDLGVLGYWEFVDGLERGFAAHHAGMLPTFREVVEELFTAGRVKLVFATETLALGINMPARTVVLERLVKFNGETHADITPAEYTQLTGRAGRRGIDVEGYAVVLWTRGLDPEAVAGLASTRTYPLRSSFRPTYNMAVNLVARVGRAPARAVLETSFAQFQADRAVVGMVRTVRRHEESLAEYAEHMTCHLGDFTEYAALREQIRATEKQASQAKVYSQRADAAASLDRLGVGDIVVVPEGRRGGLAVVVEASREGRPPGPLVVTEQRRLRRLTTVDVPDPVEPITRIKLPKGFLARNPHSRRDIAAAMRSAVPHLPPSDGRGGARRMPAHLEEQITELRRRMRAHPCHGCPDREHHARWAERWWRLERENAGLRRSIEGRTNSVATTFDRICELLVARGYLAAGGESVTADGARLQRLYTERDLLTAECLRQRTWRGLDPASLAAAVSMLVHEPRRDEEDQAPRMPNEWVERALTEMTQLWTALAAAEEQALLPVTPAPAAGMAWMVHRWASGRRLEDVLRGSDIAAGDFVRRCKQVVDLLGQVADVGGDDAVSRTARKAIDAILRGVVAADRID
ncbi:MAG: DEAD/DEAH box helicase [Actinomycetales bacterium]|nr:DEAD/DEAH box helicase [Candidatus Lutibacillus vidarii]